MNCSIGQVSVLVALAVIFNRPDCAQGNDLRGIFRYSNYEWSATTVLDALHGLFDLETGLEMEDPRRAKVAYWLDANENREWKCTLKNDQELLTELQRERTVADQERRASNSGGRFLNLEALVRHIRSNRFDFCQATVGAAFVNELDKIIASDGGDLTHLTDQLSDYINHKELGKRVGQLIMRRSNQTSLTQLFQWLDDIDYVRENYQLFSPCAPVLEAAEKYGDYLEYLELPGNYRKCRLELRDWLDRLAVCRFIDQTETVFERAARFLRRVDSSSKISPSDSSHRAVVNNDRYDSIFKYRPQQLTASYVTQALIMLESYRWGLPVADPRRAEVSFWLEAARQDESKCSHDSDNALETHLERRKAEAGKGRRSGSYITEVLNLESYVKHIRSEQLLYCEARFANRFMIEVTELNKNNFIDLCLLTKGFGHASVMKTQELGERVAELIWNRADQAGREELGRAVTARSIREHYERLSPCIGLLAIRDKFKGYYSLMAAESNYQKLRPILRNWIDKIAVCEFICESEGVFQAATGFLRQKLST